jgi:hypothetical protein
MMGKYTMQQNQWGMDMSVLCLDNTNRGRGQMIDYDRGNMENHLSLIEGVMEKISAEFFL